MVTTRNSAECTALRAHTIPIAPMTANGARIQKAAASPPFICPAAAARIRSCVMPSPRFAPRRTDGGGLCR